MRPITLRALPLFLLLAARGHAAGVDEKAVVFDLTKEGARDLVRWSPSRALDLHEDGLGPDGRPDTCWDGWVKFVEPVAVGWPHWAPPRVQILLRIDLLRHARATPGTVYARYGPDGIRWSSWQVLGAATGATAERWTHSGTLAVPRAEREAFEEACHRDAQGMPNDIDQEATLKRILEDDPRYLERAIPFIGYVQFLHESTYHGGERVRRLEARLSWGVPGPIRPPSGSRDECWRFREECRVGADGRLRVPPGADVDELSLRGTSVTDEGLAALSLLPGLRGLDLADTRVTDAGLAHVADLRALERLDLSGTRVTGEGLARLKALVSLEELRLAGTAVTDDAVAKLRESLPDPRRLRVHRQVPAEVARIEGLLKAMESPGLSFFLGPTQCDGGVAAVRLRRELDAVASRVRTAEDFIEQVAAKPSETGEPYKVRLADGSVVDLASWLREAMVR